VFGIKLPGQPVDFSDVTRAVNATGKQFGNLVGELRAAREKAEEIGKALS